MEEWNSVLILKKVLTAVVFTNSEKFDIVPNTDAVIDEGAGVTFPFARLRWVPGSVVSQEHVGPGAVFNSDWKTGKG